VLLYWGWYWRPVYESIPLIAAQLLFAYAFEALLVWSRRDRHTLGFGPFPVVFSINLFLWFKADWFFLQFAIIALGFAAKELIQWTREGRRVHVFNPSAFPLAIASLALLVTGMSDITWGQSIAITQFYPPHMYLLLFLVGLPGQFLFGVTMMTMSAAVTTYLIGLAYFAATGIYFFYDSYIPVAVFLGMLLLFTDPSTSPRTGLGRLVFGALYGLSTVLLYELLGRAGLPTFYDKLLQVPLLNLSVKWIDQVTRSPARSGVAATSRDRMLTPRGRNLAYICAWTTVFVAMSVSGGVGDDHPGQWLPFWQRACSQGRPYACPYLADLELNHCNQGSGWACNEAALAHLALSASGEDSRRLDAAQAAVPLRRGCELGYVVACENIRRLEAGRRLASASPTLDDYPIILRGSKGPIENRTAPALYALACAQGWPDTCNRTTADLPYVGSSSRPGGTRED